MNRLMKIDDRPLRQAGDRVVSPNGRWATVIEVCPVPRDVRLRFDDDLSNEKFWYYSPVFAHVSA